MTDELYTASFFQEMNPDTYKKLGKCFHKVLGVQKAIDIGCGVGYQDETLAELGWDITGADHQAVKLGLCVAPKILDIDLTKPAGHLEKYDTVICTETAEHIPEEFADTVVLHVVLRATKNIIWSAAVPGQTWVGHINLQPPEYWLEKLAVFGWVVKTDLTFKLRELMTQTGAQHYMAVGNFFVLRREEPCRK